MKETGSSETPRFCRVVSAFREAVVQPFRLRRFRRSEQKFRAGADCAAWTVVEACAAAENARADLTILAEDMMLRLSSLLDEVRGSSTPHTEFDLWIDIRTFDRLESAVRNLRRAE